MVDGPSGSEVPPNSTALRELVLSIERALTLPQSATVLEELVYLRLLRNRARCVRTAMWKIRKNREIENEPRDLMGIVLWLRAHTNQIPGEEEK